MTHERKSAQLGEVVAAAFDSAARLTGDPIEISVLAMHRIAQTLLRAERLDFQHHREPRHAAPAPAFAH